MLAWSCQATLFSLASHSALSDVCWSLWVLFLGMFMDFSGGDFSFSTIKLLTRSRKRFSTVVTNDARYAIGQFHVVNMTTLHVTPALSQKANWIRHTSRPRVEQNRTGARWVIFDPCGYWNVLNVTRHLKGKDQRSWRDDFRQWLFEINIY